MYWANVYRLSNSWTVRITATKETKENGEETWHAKVMQVNEDGTETEVKSYDVQSFKKNNRSTRKRFFEFLKESTEVVKNVLEAVKAGKDILETGEKEENTEENNE